MLNDYLQERGPKLTATDRLVYAVPPLADFWESMSVAEVTLDTCAQYFEVRKRSADTVRRELGVLRAADAVWHGPVASIGLPGDEHGNPDADIWTPSPGLHA